MLVLLGAADLACRIPARATAAAVLAGAPMQVAYLIRKLALVNVFTELADLCARAGIEPHASDPDQIALELDAFDKNDWAALAEMAGEPVNEAAWDGYARERMASVGAAG